MIYSKSTITWMKEKGGETDMPRSRKDWHKLAYRSIRWNAETERWEYFKRKDRYGCDLPGGPDVEYSYDKLSDLVEVANRIHKINDTVEGEV